MGMLTQQDFYVWKFNSFTTSAQCAGLTLAFAKIPAFVVFLDIVALALVQVLNFGQFFRGLVKNIAHNWSEKNPVVSTSANDKVSLRSMIKHFNILLLGVFRLHGFWRFISWTWFENWRHFWLYVEQILQKCLSLSIVRHFNPTLLRQSQHARQVINLLGVTLSVFFEALDFFGFFLLNSTGWSWLLFLAGFPWELTVIGVFNVTGVFVRESYFWQCRRYATFLSGDFAAGVFVAFISLLQIWGVRDLLFSWRIITFLNLNNLSLFNNLCVLFVLLGRRQHWELNFQNQMILIVLRLQACSRFFFQSDFWHNTLFATHLLELQVKLLIANAVKRLLLSFPNKQLRE